MPAGVSWIRYLTFTGAAMLSMAMVNVNLESLYLILGFCKNGSKKNCRNVLKIA